MVKKIGDYEVQDVMLEVDDTNMEGGIDVYLHDDWIGDIVGRSSGSITEDELKDMFG